MRLRCFSVFFYEIRLKCIHYFLVLIVRLYHFIINFMVSSVQALQHQHTPENKSQKL